MILLDLKEINLIQFKNSKKGIFHF